MIRRTYDIKKYFENEKIGDNIFKFDAFSHYFSAMVYETKGDWDNAIVEYKTALANIQGKGSLKEAEIQINKDLGRLAEFRNRNDILAQIKKNHPNLTWEKQASLLNKGKFISFMNQENPQLKFQKILLSPLIGQL